MKLTDITPNFADTLTEYGRTHGFPGYGMGLFGQRFYEFIATKLASEAEPLRSHLAAWFSNAFSRDNPKFKAELFQRVVNQGKTYAASPNFQQRHFWYLATLTKDSPNAEEREFMAHWLAEHVGGTNPQFKRDRWFGACGVEDGDQ